MSKAHLVFGSRGEDVAADFLKKEGYKILARNYRTKMGEIDIVARDNDTLAFVEVKTRHSDKFQDAYEAVGKRKQRQIGKAALAFLKERKLFDKKARFDVVALCYGDSSTPRPDLIKNAFELDERFSP
ncbi:MAG: YraN family protein [Candidatus Omnitrophota bacterium]